MNVIVFEETRIEDRWPWLMLILFPYILNFFQSSLMIRWYRKLLLHMIHLSLYCCNISFFSSGRYTFRASSSLLISPPPSLSPKTITFIPCGAKTQKKGTMPYPRCGFGACLRCGEHFKHSDYRADGIWHCSFFRLFPLLGSVSIVLTVLNHHFSKKFTSQKPHISAVFAGF